MDKHDHAQRELDTLYSRIFDGTTPQFPGEDEREERYAAALNVHQRTRKDFDAETQAKEQLDLANRALAAAIDNIDEARIYQKFFDRYYDMKYLRKRCSHQLEADRLVAAARDHVAQADSASPQPLNLPNVIINEMFRRYPDKKGIEESQEERVERCQLALEKCDEALKTLAAAAKERRENLQEQLGMNEHDLATARADLQRAREEVFRSVLRGGESGGSGAEDIGGLGAAEALRRRDSIPPAYEAAVEREAAPAYDT